MSDDYKSITEETKTKQYRNLVVVGCVLIIIILATYYFVGKDDALDNKKIDSSTFVSPIDKLNTESVLLERTQNKFKEQEKKTAELKNELNQLKSKETENSVENDSRYQALLKQNQLLENSLKEKNQSNNSLEVPYQKTMFHSVNSDSQNQDTRLSKIETGIDNDVLSLKNQSDLPTKNADTYVPAGSFAEAIMLGAADASAAVQSQSNPSPMLFRIVNDGVLPNHKKSHLKDCFVTAAVVGDISSERGLMRLERLSCTYPNGEIVEQTIDGTVFGRDAKNGVRGNPVWREGSLLGRAAVAGTLSGLGSAISQTYTTTSISPLGSTQTVNNGDIFKYGVSQGASNAMDKLAEYNIRRAEQYHPIIQLSAGHKVDIVFLKGFFLDGRKHDESNDDKDHEKNSSSDLFQETLTESPKGLTLSERELKKIKDNETQMGWGRQTGEMQ